MGTRVRNTSPPKVLHCKPVCCWRPPSKNDIIHLGLRGNNAVPFFLALCVPTGLIQMSVFLTWRFSNINILENPPWISEILRNLNVSFSRNLPGKWDFVSRRTDSNTLLLDPLQTNIFYCVLFQIFCDAIVLIYLRIAIFSVFLTFHSEMNKQNFRSIL